VKVGLPAARGHAAVAANGQQDERVDAAAHCGAQAALSPTFGALAVPVSWAAARTVPSPRRRRAGRGGGGQGNGRGGKAGQKCVRGGSSRRAGGARGGIPVVHGPPPVGMSSFLGAKGTPKRAPGNLTYGNPRGETGRVSPMFWTACPE